MHFHLSSNKCLFVDEFAGICISFKLLVDVGRGCELYRHPSKHFLSIFILCSGYSLPTALDYTSFLSCSKTSLMVSKCYI